MSNTQAVPLGEVADLRAGFGFPTSLQGRSSGDYPFAKVGDISRASRAGKKFMRGAENYVDESDLAVLKAKAVPPGSVLFAKIGEAIRQNHRVVADCAMVIDNNAMAAVPTESIDPAYLYRFLQTVDLYKFTSSTTVPSLRKSELEKIPVPLPSLEEQRRIAAILDHTDALRAKRREALAHLDELAQSIFIDMFGDPVLNPKCWQISTLENAGVVISSGLSVVANGGAEHTENRIIKVSAVSGGIFDHLESKPLPSDYEPPASHKIREGDLLMTRASGSIDLICITAKVDFAPLNLFLPDKIWRVSLGESAYVNEPYLIQLFKQQAFRSYVRNAASGASGVRNISQAKVLEFSAAMPPIELQDRFALVMNSVATSVGAHRAALTELNALFASLQSRAFRGEL